MSVSYQTHIDQLSQTLDVSLTVLPTSCHLNYGIVEVSASGRGIGYFQVLNWYYVLPRVYTARFDHVYEVWRINCTAAGEFLPLGLPTFQDVQSAFEYCVTHNRLAELEATPVRETRGGALC